MVWWGLIILSVLLIITSPWQVLVPDESAEDSERVTLAVMELQGRLLIGASQAQSEGIQEQLVELEIWANTDQTSIAVAAIHFFIDPEGNGRWRALALVNARLKISNESDEKSKEHPLLEHVRTVLEKPDQLSVEGRDQIRADMGWFGKVLLSAGAEEGEPGADDAASIKMQSLAMMATTGLLVLVVMAVGLLGVAILTIGLLMLKNGKLQLLGIDPSVPGQPFLGAFALYLLLMVLADFLSVTIHPFFAIGGLFGSFLIAFLWPTLRGLGWRDTLRGFGWRRGKGIVTEMAAGIVGYVAMTPVFALGLGATLVLILISGWLASNGADASGSNQAAGPVTHPAVAWVADGGWKIKLAVIFLASGLAPLFEETMFRGALYQSLRSRWGCMVSGLIGGVIFAAVHPQGLLAIPALTAMGFGFTMIREWRGTLISSMTAHGLHNGVLVSALILALS